MNAKMSKKSTKKAVVNLELGVFDNRGKEVEKLKLDGQVFDGKVSQALIHQAVTAYLANQRKGLAAAKTRGQVRGGGTKPWRQKGTGRARVGSIRSPLWEGGGVTFGPSPRSYYKELPKKMKVTALKSALNAKLANAQIVILSDLTLSSHKTKEFTKIMQNLKLGGQKVRVVVEKIENNPKLACRNLERIGLSKASDIHTTDVVNCKKLVLTKRALIEVQERVKKCL
jgi:large subunit ribosomal protein L4